MILLTATWRLPILTSAIHQPTGLAGDTFLLIDFCFLYLASSLELEEDKSDNINNVELILLSLVTSLSVLY